MSDTARPEIRGGDAVVRLVYAELRTQAAAFSVSPDGFWGGLELHRVRVATRRARSVLRAFRELLPAELGARFDAELKWLAAALGGLRDLDVYREHYVLDRADVPEDQRAALAAYDAHLDAEWERASAELARVRRSRRYETLTADLSAALRADPLELAGRAPAVTISRDGRRYIAAATTRVLKQGKRIRRSSAPEELHELRKEIKRFRYLLELFEPFFGAALPPSRKAAIRVQDVLGAHQDAFAANERLRTYVDRMPREAASRTELLALGQLLGIQHRRAVIARKRFGKRWRELETALADIGASDGT